MDRVTRLATPLLSCVAAYSNIFYRYQDAFKPTSSNQIRTFIHLPYTLTTSLTDALGTQEPRKSDAPQLRDEFRSYRTLNGTRKLFVLGMHSGC